MTMKIPDGRGFDVVVWQKPKAGAVYCAAYTVNGAVYVAELLHETIRPNVAYEMGAIHPKDFIGKAPAGLKIGGISPGARVPMRINPPLH